MDMFSKQIDSAIFEKLNDNAKAMYKPSIDDVLAEKIVKTVAEAKNPVIHVGGGVILADAARELQEFVDHMGIPVSHSLMGKGTLPDDHQLVLGMTGFWGTQFINDKCKTADYILGLGTSFKEADCSSWYPEYTFNFPATKLIHIDIDPNELGRNYPVEIGAVADLKNALTVLNRVAKRLYPMAKQNQALKDEIAAYKKAFKDSNKEVEESNQFPMSPQRILADLRDVLPRNAIITTDVGWNKNGVGQQFPIYEPGSILTPGGFATMGFGSPAALGAKVAAPDRVVVSLIGDGGFGQNPAVLATAAIENIPAIFVIMNNHAFGTIAGLEKAHFDTTLGTVFEKDGMTYSPDFAAIARAYGVEGITINKAEEFKPALEKAIAMNKPVVIDAWMVNNPVPTAGHWNIMDIYSHGKKVHHVSTN
jgi:acetolactate synthase-1/2/3 large subunit